MRSIWMSETTPEEFREEYPHVHCGREEVHDGHGWRGSRREFGGAVEVFSTFYCPGFAPETPGDADTEDRDGS